MTTIALAIALLAAAAVFGALAALGRRPRAMILAWLGCGLATSLFLLVIGFETLAVLDALLVVGSATALHLHSVLQGTRSIAEAERTVRRADWIHAAGSTATIVAIVAFALSEVPATREPTAELSTGAFTATLLRGFPELTAVTGAALFLVVVVAAAIGRPSWIGRDKEGA